MPQLSGNEPILGLNMLVYKYVQYITLIYMSIWDL
jgi:hypothetical protein